MYVIAIVRSRKVEKGRLDEEEGQGRDRLGDRRIFRVISKSVCCCMAFQQYDNLYGFGRGLQRLSSDPLPRVLPSVVFNGSPHPSLSLSFCPLFSLTPYSFLLSFPRTGRALRRPLTRTTRIALPGISEVLSRIQRLHRPSWMDRQSSLTLRLSAPPLSLSLFLPTLTPLLACSRFSFFLSPPPPSSSSLLPPVLFPPSLSNHSMRDYILRLDTREKFTSFDAP